MSDITDPDNDPSADTFVSKSQLKREALERQDLADQLLKLSSKQFAQLPVQGELLEALTVGRKLANRNARKRQLRYIARLLNEEDVAAIQALQADEHQQSLQIQARKQQIEGWCDELLADNQELLNQLVDTHPSLERQTLRQLIRQAVKEANSKGEPPNNQKLFRYLQENA